MKIFNFELIPILRKLRYFLGFPINFCENKYYNKNDDKLIGKDSIFKNLFCCRF